VGKNFSVFLLVGVIRGGGSSSTRTRRKGLRVASGQWRRPAVAAAPWARSPGGRPDAAVARAPRPRPRGAPERRGGGLPPPRVTRGAKLLVVVSGEGWLDQRQFRGPPTQCFRYSQWTELQPPAQLRARCPLHRRRNRQRLHRRQRCQLWPSRRSPRRPVSRKLRRSKKPRLRQRRLLPSVVAAIADSKDIYDISCPAC